MKLPRKERKAISINTTALPDIIFMLLFFFMVSTTIQQKDHHLVELPSANNSEVKAKKEYRDLNIYVAYVDELVYLKINGKSHDFSGMEALLKQEVQTLKANHHAVDKAILYISGEVEMTYVNAIKAELQKLAIYQLKYIHDGLT